MKAEYCQGRDCQNARQPRPLSEWPLARFYKRCGKCYKREYGADSFSYQQLVDEENHLPPRRVLLKEKSVYETDPNPL